MIDALHHIQVACPPGGEADARAFWVGALGFNEIPKPPNLAIRGGAWFRSGGCEVHVGIEEPFVPAHKAHPALLTEDLARVRALLEAAGHPTQEEEPITGFIRCYVDDPFGNRIEILQPTS